MLRAIAYQRGRLQPNISMIGNKFETHFPVFLLPSLHFIYENVANTEPSPDTFNALFGPVSFV